MEMRSVAAIWFSRLKYYCLIMAMLFVQQGYAQVEVCSYKVKDGKMYIVIGKKLLPENLNNFIQKHELVDLDLPNFFKTGSPDSLHKLGWKIEINNKEIVVISKPLFSSDNLNNPADKIIFTQKENWWRSAATLSNKTRLGYNRFTKKNPFAVHDSIVVFYLRGHIKASDVILSGSFNDWQSDALHMIKTDSGWLAGVKLAPGKYWYKFIIDGNWDIDRDNSNTENDGLGNDNSVYYKTNYDFKLNGFTNAKKVYLSGSFNNWQQKELQMLRTQTGWTLPVYLAPGTHTYRFIVDGNWMADPANPDKLSNEYNDFNSVISIGDPYIFRLSGFSNAGKVVLLGSFNNWKDNELFMIKTDTGWVLPYVLGPGNYEYRMKIDEKLIADTKTGGNTPLIIDPNFTFRLKGYADAKKVCLSGDMNNWNPTSFQMSREGDEWVFRVHLDKGKHIYKFVVDGKWILDPANKLWEQNEYHTGNSVLWFNGEK